MAKAIKFNLILDNNPVRNLDDLLDNFNIEDILAAYRNGSLKRWLETRDLANEIAELDKISGDDISVAMELCRVFHSGLTEQQIQLATYPFEFRQREAEKLEQYQDLQNQKKEIISAYHSGYDKLLADIARKGEDYAFVKAGIAELFRSYLGLYKLDADSFYLRFIKDHPLVILAMLANSNIRPLPELQRKDIYNDLNFGKLSCQNYAQTDIDAFLERWQKDNNQPEVQLINSATAVSRLRKQDIPILLISSQKKPELNGTTIESSQLEPNCFHFSYIPLSDIGQPVPSHVQSFSGQTDDYWKDLEPKEKRIMVIKMEGGNFIRKAGSNGEELGADKVNGQFPILDGIDYKSNNANHTLIYMEV